MVATENPESLEQNRTAGAGMTGAAGRALPAVGATGLVRVIWRYRAPIFGLLGFGLALYGEQLMRTLPGSGPANSELGTRMVQVAVLLVGLVSWVRDGFFARRRPTAMTASEPGAAVAPLPSRRVRTPSPSAAIRPRPTSIQQRLRRLAEGYSSIRTRLGWAGTALGLLVVVNLGLWCYMLLQQSFLDPQAPWVWVVMLAALALAFVGLRPAAGGLLSHDPAEPAEEPPVSRAEWLAVGVILLVAVALRVWNLENVPIGPYIDEGDRGNVARHINAGQPTEYGPFSFFGTDWWGVPSAYFWLVAQSLRVFGDTLAGARMVHALAGVLTVWFVYRTGRAVWSPRAGLFAAALLTISDFAIQFSRTAGESTITILGWTTCIYYLYRGLKSARMLDFVLSGLAGGLTLYGYASGKLLAPILAVVAVYLLARWGLTGIRRYLPGLALLALAAGLTFAPNGLYLLSHPDQLTARSKGVSIFSYPDQEFATYRTNNWGVVLGQQFQLTYGAFDVGGERGPFYPTRQPVLPVPWSALWVLGTAYIVWRLGDARYAVLCAWLLGGLAGAALTNETPALQRVATMVPTLALIPALFADRVVGDLLARRPVRPRWAMRALRLATAVWLVALAGLLALQTVPFYFGPYTAEAHYYEFTLVGRYAQKLDPRHDVVYQSGIPALLGSPAPTIFLAKDVPLLDIGNPSDKLPITNNEGKNAHLLFFPSDDPAISLLQSYYQGSSRTALNRTAAEPFITALRVSSQQIDAMRVTQVRYGPPGGPIYERTEPRLGTAVSAGPAVSESVSAPVWMTYPLRAQWSGGLFVPVYGTYKFYLTVPAGDASLDIDGRTQLRSGAGKDGAQVRLVLARGVHQVRLAGTLAGPQGQVELRWGADTGLVVPVARQFLWNGPPGALTGSYYLKTDIPDFITEAHPAIGNVAPAMERRDQVLDWHNINAELEAGGTLAARWSGKLVAPVDGSYTFDADSDSMVSIWVDGRVVGILRAASGSPQLPAAVELRAGEHDLEVRYKAMREQDHLAVYWQLPGGAPRQLLSASAFKPPEGGVWTPAERPNAPGVNPELLNVGGVVLPVKVARVINGNQTWNQARGVAVLPNWAVVVGNTGNHELLVLNTAGGQLKKWGKEGVGDGAFNTISDVAVGDDGLIAVLDAENNDIQLFTGDGIQANRFGGGQLGMAHASGIAWGPDGKLYVADTTNNRVLRVQRAGQPEAYYGAGGGEHQPFEQPTDVALTADGHIYVVDLRGRVVHFTPDGAVAGEYQVPVSGSRGGSHLAVWGDLLAVTDPDASRINFIDLKTGQVFRAGTLDNTPLGLNLPVGVATGPDGRLYVLDSGNNRVVALEREK